MVPEKGIHEPNKSEQRISGAFAELSQLLAIVGAAVVSGRLTKKHAVQFQHKAEIGLQSQKAPNQSETTLPGVNKRSKYTTSFGPLLVRKDGAAGPYHQKMIGVAARDEQAKHAYRKLDVTSCFGKWLTSCNGSSSAVSSTKGQKTANTRGICCHERL